MSKVIKLEFDHDLEYIKLALQAKKNHLETMVYQVVKENPKNVEFEFIQKWGNDIANIQGILDRLP